MSPDGEWFVSEGPGFTIGTWRAARNDRLATLPHPDDVERVSCSPDGRSIATIDDAHDVRVFESTGARKPGVANLFNSRSMRFSADGRFLDVYGQTGLHRVDIDAGMSGRQITADINDIAYGGSRAATIMRGGAWLLWDLTTGGSQPGPGETRAYAPIAMTRDARYLAATYGGRANGEDTPETVRVWDLADDTLVWDAELAFHAFDLAISDDGRTLVAYTDGRAALLRADGNGPARELPFAGELRAVAFAADDRLIVGAVGANIYVWSSAGERAPLLLPHNTDITSLQASPDGRYLTTAAGNVVAVWDLASGELISQWSNSGRISQVCFLDDAKYVVTGDDQDNAIVWRWQRNDLVDQACATLSRNFTREEWTRYFGDRPYRKTCADLPGPDEPAED
jgi:WD40 repeat protein